WNGATEVASWRVLSGDDEDHLSENTEVERTGFETAADITPNGSKIVVEALDADGRHLASTRVGPRSGCSGSSETRGGDPSRGAGDSGKPGATGCSIDSRTAR